MATVENQNLYEFLQSARVSEIELKYPDEVKRISRTPLDSKVTCTLLELARFAKRVRDEAKAESLDEFKAWGHDRPVKTTLI
ncbi:hypothetical protein AQJ43_23700 [Streptomyces avermitilis]|uniref:Uncharacterized protein n=2 Tax=Streptomyces avermitilis TaxID=33903 RepID=Q82C31_STRAW|nr:MULTISPECIES: hypothetical protein [Streptomyces]KUN52233.1 hypothetical protein AQJ43_23700 [Streptomyces avermitilis]MYT01103.1 hypothetical protein [Streptomyces sp. SID5469]OOV30719.1 hypothetical protein SM007_16070 [Streptomyces avermitilis]BAC73235.1 hypothetical protein SAVERM_5523 [Streptomyces avermitilis MA-4680 = NBRC 14893]BBJ53679.1 hypothetical protein SAVMC3_63080 [Streptomyces avermitilis]